MSRTKRVPRRLPLARLSELADSHAERWHDLAPGVAIDNTRYFMAPEATPLFYTDCYQQLSREQERRYNQLTGIAFSELIHFFEVEIG